MIGEQSEQVRERIAAACRRSGRDPAAVTLVAVSKTRTPDAIAQAAAAGWRIFGESRVQEASAKIDQCPSGLCWHFIGHLQRNKVRQAAALFDMIHSLDSLPLVEALDAAAGQAGRRIDVCIQVNVAGETSKFGVAPDQTVPLVAAAARCHHLNVCGLMTVPPAVREPDDVRPYFRRLHQLRALCYDAAGTEALGLSMGMSHDFEIAIEEGATWIRVGTAIFGRRSV